MAQAEATLTGPGVPPVRENNKLRAEDFSVHDWYRFVLSYPPHLVRDYLTRFGVGPDMTALDPFCGTGTTLVECKKLGIRSVGIEANPMPCFASGVKIDWDVDPEDLLRHTEKIAEIAIDRLEQDGLVEAGELPLFDANNTRSQTGKLRTLSADIEELLLTGSIS